MGKDILIVGAGFAGLTLAERLSSIGKHCVVIDRRNHIGGNAYDYVNAVGVLVHKYGPHIFHTNSAHIFEYLSRFTQWHDYQHRVKSFVDGKFWSFPINLETVEQLLGRSTSTEEMEQYLRERRIKIFPPTNSEEAIISQVGWELYERFYKGYTIKQWNRNPRELDASVCRRIPIRTTRDDRYFTDTYQGLPADGYTQMFSKMLYHPRISVFLNTDYRGMHHGFQHTVYTGPIDEFFGYAHGPLPYRSLRFEQESFKQYFWQPTTVVNYPNSEEFTRIVEIKHATGQITPSTTIVREYATDEGEPYYPVPAPDSARIYQKYKVMAENCKNVSFVGRLATYRYLNMDQVVASALHEFQRLRAIL